MQRPQRPGALSLSASIAGQRPMSRRGLLRGGAAVAATAATTLASGTRVRAASAPGLIRDTLLLINLRGGLDGVSLCVPHGDPDYYIQRPTYAVPLSSTLDIDGFFGMNAAAAPLMSLYQRGHLALIPASGLPHPTRSHFEAIQRTEEAVVDQALEGTGWLARHLNATPPVGTGSARAIAVATTLPGSLFGTASAAPIPKLAEFGYSGPPGTQARRYGVNRAMYDLARDPDRTLGIAAHDMLSSIASIDFVNRVPGNGATYAGGIFSTALFEAATLIKSNVGIEAIEVDLGGWDDHRNIGTVSGRFAARVDSMSRSLEALVLDLGEDLERTTILIMSEFGRRMDENGAGGVDHGAGGLTMVLGGEHVLGGQIHGQWPGLGPDQLDDEAVAITTDIRDIIGEILVKRMGNTDPIGTLPNHALSFPGIIG